MNDVIVVAALYRFTRLDDYQNLREPLLACMTEAGVRGTLLLAREGINGTIAGSREGIDAVLAWLAADGRFQGLEYKESYTHEPPFLRTKVKLKKEIVTMGVEDLDPDAERGTYLEAEDWNRVIADPETLVIDTRNDYEYEVGTFAGAMWCFHSSKLTRPRPRVRCSWRIRARYLESYTATLKQRKRALRSMETSSCRSSRALTGQWTNSPPRPGSRCALSSPASSRRSSPASSRVRPAESTASSGGERAGALSPRTRRCSRSQASPPRRSHSQRGRPGSAWADPSRPHHLPGG